MPNLRIAVVIVASCLDLEAASPITMAQGAARPSAGPAAASAAALSLKQDMRKLWTLPSPATLLSPPDGQMPRPPDGQRFGVFNWRPSQSDDVVVEIVEFAYKDDVRLIVSRPQHAGAERQMSAGQLWTTRGEWKWRVWSLTGAGDVVFSDIRSFVH